MDFGKFNVGIVNRKIRFFCSGPFCHYFFILYPHLVSADEFQNLLKFVEKQFHLT